MRIGFALLVGLHGLIHLLGAAKAFRWAEVAQLKQPISPATGTVWLAAGVILIVAAVAVGVSARWWWWLALPGVLLSQWLIMHAWGDARFGTVANIVIAVPLLLLLVDALPSSFGSRFISDRTMLLARPGRPVTVVSEADIVTLPPLIQTYLRRVGAVGRARPRNLRVVFAAQMRGSPTEPWMEARATQYEFFDAPARLFHMNATKGGLPVDVYHRYVDSAATFQVRLVGLYPMVNAKGQAMTNDETVTLMNDVLVMAPAAVLDLPFTFETTGEHTLHATFTNAGFTVAAELTFDTNGDLIGFTSKDRAHGREGGDAVWSTPLSGYREVHGIRIPALGDANWIDSAGEWTYGRFEIRDIAYNVTR